MLVFSLYYYSLQFNFYLKTGSTEESKEKADQQPGVDESEKDEKLNQAHEDEEGNLSDEGEEEQEGTGQQGQEGLPDTDEPANLDLPEDLQLDEEGNEETEGRLCYVLISQISCITDISFINVL